MLPRLVQRLGLDLRRGCARSLLPHRRLTTATPTSGPPSTRLCVVGAGAAGLYACELLRDRAAASQRPVRVDVLERWPVPFGLVRFGVAPDHPEVKRIESRFAELFAPPSTPSSEYAHFRFLGNVVVGRDVSLGELQRYYDAVLLAHGADTERMLGVPGEDEVRGVFSARDFVAWCNALPDERTRHLAAELAACLANARDVVIVGQGNVALDVARLLVKDVRLLAHTDLARDALTALATSPVQHVHVLGRRGAVHAAFTTKELRELTKLEGVNVRIWGDTLPALTPSDEEELRERALRRKYDLLREIEQRGQALQHGAAEAGSQRTVWLHFHTVPLRFETDTPGGQLQRVHVAHTNLTGAAHAQRAVIDTTRPPEVLPAQVAFVAVGYTCAPLEGVPLDAAGRVAHDGEGRVRALDAAEQGAALGRVYVTGWAKRGASGIIGTNLVDAEQSVSTLWHDLSQLPSMPSIEGDEKEDLVRVLRARGVRVVTWEDWLRIDAEEQRRGAREGTPRLKVASVPEMLRLLDQSA